VTAVRGADLSGTLLVPEQDGNNSAKTRGAREDRRCPGLQPAHIKKVGHEPAELVEGFLGGGEQFLAIGRSESGTGAA
jgi:hypothetical protein